MVPSQTPDTKSIDEVPSKKTGKVDERRSASKWGSKLGEDRECLQSMCQAPRGKTENISWFRSFKIQLFFQKSWVSSLGSSDFEHGCATAQPLKQPWRTSKRKGSLSEWMSSWSCRPPISHLNQQDLEALRAISDQTCGWLSRNGGWRWKADQSN